jgi:hypothetical protein
VVELVIYQIGKNLNVTPEAALVEDRIYLLNLMDFFIGHFHSFLDAETTVSLELYS